MADIIQDAPVQARCQLERVTMYTSLLMWPCLPVQVTSLGSEAKLNMDFADMYIDSQLAK